MKIWIVEDDPDFVVGLQQRLQKFVGLETEVLQRPTEAMTRIVEGERPDLIVSDYVFAGEVTGADVVRSARIRGISAMLCSDLDPRYSPPDVRITRKVDLLTRAFDLAPWLASAC